MGSLSTRLETRLDPGNRGVILRSPSDSCFKTVSSLREGQSRSDRGQEGNGSGPAQVRDPWDRDI